MAGRDEIGEVLHQQSEARYLEIIANTNRDIEIFGQKILDATVDKASLRRQLDRLERRMQVRATQTRLMLVHRLEFDTFRARKLEIFERWWRMFADHGR